MDFVLAKILIIEDHPIMGNAVCSSVAAHIDNAKFEQVTTLTHALHMLQMAKNAQQPYALIVTDLHLADSQGLATLEALKALSQSTPIVVLSMNDEPKVIQACKSLAENYISKSDTSNEFELAIRAVVQQAGHFVQKKPVQKKASGQAQVNAEIAQLTPKQNEVLAELAQGYSNKEIAKRLHLSDETVRGHLAEIFKRLGVQNRTQATKYYLLKSHAQSQP
jgi:two-component system nitrate/nitrite response regulator NarP